MPFPQEKGYTSEDYWNLPEDHRAELIEGKFYDMAPPKRIHQELVMELSVVIREHIREKGGNCKIYPAPFAVNLDREDRDWVEPDISVVCDPAKLTDRGCSGAPDLVAEIVSPSSSRMDYVKKLALYSETGVREYWIVDPDRGRTTVYFLEKADAPVLYSFDQPIASGIFPGLVVTVSDLLSGE